MDLIALKFWLLCNALHAENKKKIVFGYHAQTHRQNRFAECCSCVIQFWGRTLTTFAISKVSNLFSNVSFSLDRSSLRCCRFDTLPFVNFDKFSIDICWYEGDVDNFSIGNRVNERDKYIFWIDFTSRGAKLVPIGFFFRRTATTFSRAMDVVLLCVFFCCCCLFLCWKMTQFAIKMNEEKDCWTWPISLEVWNWWVWVRVLFFYWFELSV